MRSRRSRPARAALRHPSTCPQKPFGNGWTTRWTHTCRRMPKRCGTGWIATLIGISPPQTQLRYRDDRNDVHCTRTNCICLSLFGIPSTEANE